MKSGRRPAMPTGGFHSAISRARSASISDCDSWAALPMAAPSDGVELSCSPVAALRCGSRLSSSAAILSASNLGCCFCGGFFGGSGSFLGLLFVLVLLLELLGDRIGLGLRLRLRRLLRRRLDFLFLGELGRRLLDRLRLVDLLHQRLGHLGLGRCLDALGHFARSPSRSPDRPAAIRPASLRASCRKTTPAPTAAPPRAGRPRSLRRYALHRYFFELCSNSVTKATRWKPADDSRPITFIMVP